jgi:hypothetical protein
MNSGRSQVIAGDVKIHCQLRVANELNKLKNALIHWVLVTRRPSIGAVLPCLSIFWARLPTGLCAVLA